jgi:hypothetical protein
MASTTIFWERDWSLAERGPITGVRSCDHEETPNELIAALSRDMGHPNQLHEFVFGLGQPFGPVDGLLNPETQCSSRTHRRPQFHRRLRPRAG